jgi:hypothetical protein
MGWIGLAQDRDKWRVLVNTVMNLTDNLKKVMSLAIMEMDSIPVTP